MRFDKFYHLKEDAQNFQSTYDPKEKLDIGSFVFDNYDGAGSVSDNLNINYKGFVVFMKPSEFLSLTPERPFGTDPKTFESVESIGSPFLEVDDMSNYWKVESHEGRGRVMSILNLDKDMNKIPIHIFVYGERASDLNSENLKRPFSIQNKENKKINIDGPYYLEGSIIK